MNSNSVYKTPEGEKAVMAIYDSVLERWPVPCETLTVPTRYGDTFVVASGPETLSSLVLLHGAGTNSAIWAGDVTFYSRYYRTYAVDLLGEAGHSSPNRHDWKGPAFTEWLEEVLNALKLESTILVGISQGAWASLKFAVAHPERVEKLVLLCPGGVIPDKMSFIFKAVLYSMLGKRGIKALVRMLYADQPVAAGTEEITAVMLRHFRSRVGVLPIFTDAVLKRLEMPVLLLGGTKDALRDNAKIGERLKSLLPRLEITLVPGAGHAILNTTERIRLFLNPEEGSFN